MSEPWSTLPIPDRWSSGQAPGWRRGQVVSCACRVTVADIEKELAELRDSQERGKVSMEHSVSEASLYLQDQVRIPHLSVQGPGCFSELALDSGGGSPATIHQPLLSVPLCVCACHG